MSARGGGEREPRWCTVCGRSIQWRKKWERDWEWVKFCSKSCRAHGITPVDGALEAAIIELLSSRNRGATICPSEAARLVAERSNATSTTGGMGAGGEEPWRALMEQARMAARRLVVRGIVQITQGGRVVDPDTAKGPIRVRLVR